MTTDDSNEPKSILACSTTMGGLRWLLACLVLLLHGAQGGLMGKNPFGEKEGEARSLPDAAAAGATSAGGGAAASVAQAASRDAMVGYATGYGVDVLWRLAAAFHAVTKPNADLVLFVTLTRPQRRVLLDAFPGMRGRLILLNPNEVLPRTATYRGIDLAALTHAAFRRYAIIGKWLDGANAQGRYA